MTDYRVRRMLEWTPDHLGPALTWVDASGVEHRLPFPADTGGVATPFALLILDGVILGLTPLAADTTTGLGTALGTSLGRD